MDTSKVHNYHNYSYQILSRAVSEGKHQGIILILAHGGNPYIPTKEILTPTTFRKHTAAQIEATALAYELINSGAIEVLLRPFISRSA
jgi:hypothetical protein